MGTITRSIKWKEGQKVVHNLPGKRGIRMDFCVEDGDECKKVILNTKGSNNSEIEQSLIDFLHYGAKLKACLIKGAWYLPIFKGYFNFVPENIERDLPGSYNRIYRKC